MAHETLLAGAWLHSRLKTDVELFPPDPDVPPLISGVFRRAAPQNAALPYCVWNWQGDADENAAGGAAYATPVALVKVVSDDRVDSASVEAALHRIDEILTSVRDYVSYRKGQATHWFSIAVQRAGIIDYPENGEATHFYQHQGRMWAITVIECNDPGLGG